MKHENYSLGYDLLRVHARFLHRLVHRSITVTGLENIPKNTPIIFAPNHQNALMDAMAVLLTCPQQPVWLARADIFGKPAVDAILKFLKISPVYRIRDGKDSLSKNDEVFDLSIRVLKNNKSLALFPEAQHNFRRQSIAHKKAVPRIAFMAEEREHFELGIQIIPVGLYYSKYYALNRELIVNFGKPIHVSDFKAQYLENQNAAIMALRTEIHSKLIPLTLDIPDKEHYYEYETLIEIDNNSSTNRNSVLQRFGAEQETARKIELWATGHPEEAAALFEDTRKYQKSIDKLKITDSTISKQPGYFNTIVNAFLAILSLPLFLYGWINYAVSFILPSWIVRKKMRNLSFWATFDFVLWIILVPLFALMQTSLVWIFTKEWWVALVYLVTLPLFGKLSMCLADFYRTTLEGFRYLKNRKALKSIIKLRKQTSSILNKIIQ